jgi:hypothetical protein
MHSETVRYSGSILKNCGNVKKRCERELKKTESRKNIQKNTLE